MGVTSRQNQAIIMRSKAIGNTNTNCNFVAKVHEMLEMYHGSSRPGFPILEIPLSIWCGKVIECLRVKLGTSQIGSDTYSPYKVISVNTFYYR